MADNYKDLFEPGDCIPQETMLGYLEGRLSPREANRVEQHLLSCEFCCDALEGLKLMQPGMAEEALSDIHQRIDQRLEKKTAKVLPFGSFYRIAAIIVLVALFGGGYLLLKKNTEEKNLAVNEPVKQTDTVQTYLEPQASSSTPTPEKITSAPVLSENVKSLALEQSQQATKKIAREVIPATDVMAQSNDIAKQKVDVESITPKTNDDQIALAKDENEGNANKEVSNAIRDYHSGAAAPASTEMKEVQARQSKAEERTVDAYKFNSKPVDTNALFNSGKVSYDQKNYDAAAIDFEKVVNDTSSLHYDDAKWFLANCYMKLHKNTKARKLLREISNSNSIHKKEAFGLLQENQ